jgi:serine/threonine protein phosphatase PrpC/CRP-like cAMP-binding protein
VIVESASRTDVGRVRSRNEDSVACAPDLNLYIVADGMGGHQGGDEASRHACAGIEEHIRGKWYLVAGFQDDPVPTRRRQVLQLLTEAIRSANDRIVLTAEQTPELQGMGSTVVLVLFAGDRAFVAHVGDSRAYLLRDGAAVLLTEDHSLLFELLRQGRLTRAQALRFPMKNVVTRALGIRGPVEPDVMDLPVLPGDRILLCSDGLHGYVEDERLPRLAGEGGLQAVADRLVAFANAGGGADNISAVIAEVKSLGADPATARASFLRLRSMPLFQGLTLSELLRLLSTAEHRRFRQGEAIVRDAVRPEGLHVVLSGSVAMRRGTQPGVRLGLGAVFGDLSLLEDQVPDFAVVALETTDVAVVTRRAFEALSASSPLMAVRLLRQLARGLAHRLHTANDEAAILRTLLERESVVTPLFRTGDILTEDLVPVDSDLTPTEGLRSLEREESDGTPES